MEIDNMSCEGEEDVLESSHTMDVMKAGEGDSRCTACNNKETAGEVRFKYHHIHVYMCEILHSVTYKYSWDVHDIYISFSIVCVLCFAKVK